MKVERIANVLMSGGVDKKRARDLAPHLAAMIRDDEEELRAKFEKIRTGVRERVENSYGTTMERRGWYGWICELVGVKL